MPVLDELYTELSESFSVVITKLNYLGTNKEDKANKRNDLTSNNPIHFPTVPAVVAGLIDILNEAKAYTDSEVSGSAANYIPLSQKGAPNGVAPLDGQNLIPAQYLPSFVDDVVDLVNFVSANPSSGMVAGQKWYNTTNQTIFTATSATTGTSAPPESGKIYINTSNNTTWRWSGTVMAQMNGGLTLGTTATTAFRGDWGLMAYNHSQSTGNPHNTQMADIPNLVGELADKATIRLGNVVSNLTAQERLDFRNKIGAGTANNDGTVTSVNMTTPTGLVVTGGPITQSGTFAISFAVGYSIPPNNKQTQWDAAYAHSVLMGNANQPVPDWSGQLTAQVNF